MAADFFSRLQAYRSVLKRTRKRPDLPEVALYTGPGAGRRNLLDKERGEHQLTDQVLQSHFKLVTGSEAKRLIEAHWADDVAKPQEPVRKS